VADCDAILYGCEVEFDPDLRSSAREAKSDRRWSAILFRVDLALVLRCSKTVTQDSVTQTPQKFSHTV
jgi:hypothetical protein